MPTDKIAALRSSADLPGVLAMLQLSTRGDGMLFDFGSNQDFENSSQVIAFANAGVHILGSIAEATKHPVTLGVVLGLFAGKPLGIMLFAWCSSRTKLTTPPAGVPWRQVFGAGCLCGIGFTMSLFVATLALSEGNLLNMSKIGILAASVGAGICGSLILSGRNSQLGQCSRFSPNN